jgi:proteasome component ECM29
VQLLPKLFRYQFDLNPKINASMRNMWQNVVDNPRDVLNEYFVPIMDELMRSLLSVQYRARHASCLALCEIVKGRDFDAVGAYLAPLWLACFKVMDDMNEDVRKAALSLSKCLGRLCNRLVDPRYSTKSSGVAGCLEATVPVMLDHGIGSRVKEVRQVAIRFVLHITKVSNKFLRPALARIMKTLLESLSTLEPKMLSYWQFHVDDKEKMESVRLRMASSSPLSEALTACVRQIDDEVLPDIVSMLSEVMATGVGLPTLTGSARVLTSIGASPVGPQLQAHAPKLLRILFRGLVDESLSVRKLFARAIGFVCRIAKRKRVQKTLVAVAKMYLEPKSALAQEAGGMAASEISLRALEMTKRYAIDIAPVAFVAMHHSSSSGRNNGNDAKQSSAAQQVARTAAAWGTCWEEISPGSTSSGARLYRSDIVALFCKQFARDDSISWELKRALVNSIAALAALTKSAFAPHLESVLDVLVAALPGRLWSGKEDILSALATIGEACSAELQSSALAQSVLAALLVETKRRKTVYKRNAVVAVSKWLESTMTSADAFVPVWQCFSPLLRAAEPLGSKHQQLQQQKVEASSASLVATVKPLTDPRTIAAACEAIGWAWPAAAAVASSDADGDVTMSDAKEEKVGTAAAKMQTAYCDKFVDLLTDRMQSGFAWNVKAAIMHACKVFAQRLAVKDDAVLLKVLELIALGLHDLKYVAVRLAAAQALHALLQSRGSTWTLLNAPPAASQLELSTKVIASLDDALACLQADMTPEMSQFAASIAALLRTTVTHKPQRLSNLKKK